MTPRQSRGEASHEPGPLLLAMLRDLGWTIRDPVLQIPHFGVGRRFEFGCCGYQSFFYRDRRPWRLISGARTGANWMGTRYWALVRAGSTFCPLPLGSRTLTLSNDGGGVLTGSVTVSSDTPVSAVVRFDLRGTGITGVGTSPRLREAIAPVRRAGNLSSGVAVRNIELAAQMGIGA